MLYHVFYHLENDFYQIIKVTKWYFEMGIMPNTHKYVFNMCIDEFELFY